jgi:hypothetical protein
MMTASARLNAQYSVIAHLTLFHFCRKGLNFGYPRISALIFGYQ